MDVCPALFHLGPGIGLRRPSGRRDERMKNFAEAE
jgi:hypothetical protein